MMFSMDDFCKTIFPLEGINYISMHSNGEPRFARRCFHKTAFFTERINIILRGTTVYGKDAQYKRGGGASAEIGMRPMFKIEPACLPIKLRKAAPNPKPATGCVSFPAL